MMTHRKGASRVCVRSAQAGTGVIAGGSMRAMFEALGVQDIVSKSMGTGNSYNVLRSTFRALALTESPRGLSKRRGLSINEINHRRKILLTKEWEEQV
jgi:small subunit ribosomal protein S5